MTCWSCRHVASERSRVGGVLLFCGLRREPAKARCERFEYEPGADEGERHAAD